LPGTEFDLPFEDQPPYEMALVGAKFSGGVVISAGTIPARDGAVLPALIYRFAKADGSGFYPPIVFAHDEEHIIQITQLTSVAALAAVEAARG